MTIETELPAVKVKALEWLDNAIGGWISESSIGDYELNCWGYGDAEEWELVGPTELICRFAVNSLDEAKAAAQADYDSRILSALTLKDDPGNGGKPVICIGHHTINQLMAGQDVEIEAAIMVPASDLRQPTPADEISALRTRCEKAEAERDEAKASRDLQARIASDEEGLSRAAESRCEELEAALAETRAAALEEAAKLAAEFHWQLPMYADAAVNEATDDAACAVQEQIAAAIRALIPREG